MSDTFISLKPKRDVALFDLDGTVLDTYAPILESMRYATKTVFGEALPDSKLVSMVGSLWQLRCKRLPPNGVAALRLPTN